MADVLLSQLRDVVDPEIFELFKSGSYVGVLQSPQGRQLFHGQHMSHATAQTWQQCLRTHAGYMVEEGLHGVCASAADIAVLALACLNAFLQANVTGPPLDWSPAKILFPNHLQDKHDAAQLSKDLISSLSVDGEATYRHLPYAALFATAKGLADIARQNSPSIAVAWIRFRVNSWHQRLLSEAAPSLQGAVRDDVDFLASEVLAEKANFASDIKITLLLEEASVSLLYGDERASREKLRQAAILNDFRYVLTGWLGKRTKFQTFDVSQLVVLAKSSSGSAPRGKAAERSADVTKPEDLDLNDDTLLDKIAYTADSAAVASATNDQIPEDLKDIDPGNQSILSPLDSINLLVLATSITNTSPDDGITREETLPYAVRVLEGGSSNWQIYSQALLVRSRVEGYSSRTVERSVLQMQVLVDQVIAETSDVDAVAPHHPDQSQVGPSTTTFLPRPKQAESASAAERLQYIHMLASPTRWSIEAELAQRWVSVGGLRTALETYERLEMWAEAALCLAALEDEKRAKNLVIKQLYQDVNQRKERDPSQLPNDAPRLFCILGDLEEDIALYERSWEVSKQRYARAQRSLGRHYMKKREFDKADKSYYLSLNVNPQNSQAWFSLGCIRLELRNWKGAVEAFSRVVQREQDDAEAWSNLAAALLRLPPEADATAEDLDDGEVESLSSIKDPQINAKQALVAFKRAANLKREDFRMWHNVLNVAATLSPPPYNDVVIAESRIIDLQGSNEGEGCLDIEILEGLLNHIIQISSVSNSMKIGDERENVDGPRKTKHGLERMFLELMNKKVVPLITHSRRLWLLVAKFNIYLNKPSAALEAYEKAWRTATNKPGWDNESGFPAGSSTHESKTKKTTGSAGGAVDSKTVWRDVVNSTIELVDAYESLGDKEVTEGLKAGSGEVVCRNWKQKSRMAIRSVTGRRNKAGLGGMEELQQRMEQLKAS